MIIMMTIMIIMMMNMISCKEDYDVMQVYDNIWLKVFT